jgi:hypothetical protein
VHVDDKLFKCERAAMVDLRPTSQKSAFLEIQFAFNANMIDDRAEIVFLAPVENAR